MTALIGGLCVGIIWGVWVTHKLIKYKKITPKHVKRSQDRYAKLQFILNSKNHGKETERKTKKADGPDDTGR